MGWMLEKSERVLDFVTLHYSNTKKEWATVTVQVTDDLKINLNKPVVINGGPHDELLAHAEGVLKAVRSIVNPVGSSRPTRRLRPIRV